VTAHWGVEDPAAFQGPEDQQRQLLFRVYLALENRIKIFTNLRLDDIDQLALKKRLDDIGHAR
jgi:hypothetical protein